MYTWCNFGLHNGVTEPSFDHEMQFMDPIKFPCLFYELIFSSEDHPFLLCV